jgi:hypothetical protein
VRSHLGGEGFRPSGRPEGKMQVGDALDKKTILEPF